MKINTLYLPLSKQETLWGGILLAVYMLGCAVIGVSHYAILCIFTLAVALALVFVMRDFLSQTIFNISLLGKKIWLRPILATVLNLVLCTFLNDIFLLYDIPYFVDSDWGPILWNVRGYMLSQQSMFWPLALIVLFAAPLAEELLFRQLIFSCVYPKSKTLAITLSVLLYAAFHVIGYIGHVPMLYLAIYAIQFIPLGLFLCWLYSSTDSIVAPLWMHILCNIVVINNALSY